ncbi:MAG: YfiR family protein [Burkholderiales bacterium]|nr:YfiR family protein [Burkholderiales bacterium]
MQSRRSLITLAAALAAAAWRGARAQPDKPRESLVKAAFLHKFASFVDWPEGTFPRPDTPLRIAVMGDDQVFRDLRELARDRDRDGRPVLVTRVIAGDPLSGFHILYLKAPSAARLAEVIPQVPEGVLTVADSDGTHPRGSVISFFLDEGRVRFGASVDAAARQKLRLSPRLLSVARSIQGGVSIDADQA